MVLLRAICQYNHYTGGFRPAGRWFRVALAFLFPGERGGDIVLWVLRR